MQGRGLGILASFMTNEAVFARGPWFRTADGGYSS